MPDEALLVCHSTWSDHIHLPISTQAEWPLITPVNTSPLLWICFTHNTSTLQSQCIMAPHHPPLFLSDHCDKPCLLPVPSNCPAASLQCHLIVHLAVCLAAAGTAHPHTVLLRFVPTIDVHATTCTLLFMLLCQLVKQQQQPVTPSSQHSCMCCPHAKCADSRCTSRTAA